MEDVNWKLKRESAWWRTLFGNKELLKWNVSLRVKKWILQCYIFPVLKYACESWTLNNNLINRINAFEQWYYRRLLKIKWIDKVSNEETLCRINEKESHLYRSIQKQKLDYAGHILWGSYDQNILHILEGKFDIKAAQRRPRRMWLDDIIHWTKLNNYKDIKRTEQLCQPSYAE